MRPKGSKCGSRHWTCHVASTSRDGLFVGSTLVWRGAQPAVNGHGQAVGCMHVRV